LNKRSLKVIFILYFVGAVISLIILSICAVYFNVRLVANQSNLKDINVIDTSRYMMSSGLEDFLIKQTIILTANSPDEIRKLVPQSDYSKEFLDGLASLQSVANYHPGLQQSIVKMQAIFQAFLIEDQKLNTVALETLHVSDQINSRAMVVGQRITDLQNNASEISGILSLNYVESASNINHYLQEKTLLNNTVELRKFKDAVQILLGKDIISANVISKRLNTNLALLISLTNKLSTETDPDKLISLKTNEITQLISEIDRELQQLSDEVTSNPDIQKKVSQMKIDFHQIVFQIINDPDNIFELRQNLNKEKAELKLVVKQVNNSMNALDTQFDEIDGVVNQLRTELLKKTAVIAFAARFVIIGIAFVLLILMMGAGYYILQEITKAMRSLMTAMQTIIESKNKKIIDLDYHLKGSKFRELDDTANAFNIMIKKLQYIHAHLEELVTEKTSELTLLQKELIAASRQAGMSEIAASVLHNIGNVLNSVNMSIDKLNEILNGSAFSDTSRTLSLLKTNLAHINEYLTQDPKGKLLPEYLITLLSAIDDARLNIHKEGTNLNSHFNHIHEFVNMQNAISGQSSVFIEEISIKEALDAAMKMYSPQIKNWDEIVDIKMNEPIVIKTDKSRLIQIMINLLQNAVESLLLSNQNTLKKITIKLSQNKQENYFEMLVQDNGIGIKPEDIIKIFTFGFTTKKKGQGFGLHNSFLSAKELGGSLRVESDGEGRGASFYLRLPISKNK